MYRLGEPEKSSRRGFRYIVIGLVLVTAVAASFMLFDARRNSKITVSTTPPQRSEVPLTTTPTKKITEPFFSLKLPQDFAEIERTAEPRSITWQSTDKKTTARKLKVYIDNIPANLPLNRLQPVTVSGDKIIPGDISDNCANFVGTTPMTPQLAGKVKPTPAKWQDISFICDLPNYLREVAGTGTDGPGGPNLQLQGSQGTHRYLFIYTDHTNQPDFMIFKNILSSFIAT